MNLKNLIDCHTHSNFSPDAKNSPQEMCERAIELGLAAYAITDHCDCNMWYGQEHYFDEVLTEAEDRIMYGAGEYALKSILAQQMLREKYDGRLNFICGIELGQPLQNVEKAEEIVATPGLDFIIGSHHQNADEKDFYFFDYAKMSAEEIRQLMDKYFSEMLDMCVWGKFDVLGHLTYPLRYMEGQKWGISVEMKPHEEIIREIFRTLIHTGKGIEINTSGLRQSYGKTFPTLDLLKMYHEMGGNILSLGSDSHCVADLGKGIFEGAEIAKVAGFKYIAYFKNRKPNFIEI